MDTFKPKVWIVYAYVVFLVCFLAFGLLPAGAVEYKIAGELSIPEINLTSEVAALDLEEDGLNTPDDIVGSYSRAENKTLLIGHSSTVFHDADEISVGSEIYYNDAKYTVSDIVVSEKNDINMYKLLKKSDVDTLVIMTCAGEDLDNGDATHRLIITAVNV